MAVAMHNVTVNISYGRETPELSNFFKFMEKKLKTKRHINALVAANIESVRHMEEKLEDIALLRGLGEKSAREVTEAYAEWKRSLMTPEQRKVEEMQDWTLARAAQEVKFDVGSTVFFFTRGDSSNGARPKLRAGHVCVVQFAWGHARADERRTMNKNLSVRYSVWNEDIGLNTYESDELFATNKEAIASIQLVK